MSGRQTFFGLALVASSFHHLASARGKRIDLGHTARSICCR